MVRSQDLSGRAVPRSLDCRGPAVTALGGLTVGTDSSGAFRGAASNAKLLVCLFLIGIGKQLRSPVKQKAETQVLRPDCGEKSNGNVSVTSFLLTELVSVKIAFFTHLAASMPNY